MRQTCLMLGAGHTSPTRKIRAFSSAPDEYTDWVRLDNNPDCRPDVLFDLNDIERGNKLPFPDDTFDEIHAYEVMEHYGQQGHYVEFFTGMRELWRVLKPNGVLLGMSPSMTSVWAWGDPGHSRIVSHQMLTYLSHNHYSQLGVTASSDYRKHVDPCWWDIDGQTGEEKFQFALVKTRLVA